MSNRSRVFSPLQALVVTSLPTIAQEQPAAVAKAKILMTLSVDDAAWNQYIAERNARRGSNPISTFVTVDGDLSHNNETHLAGMVGRPINFDELF